MAYVSQEMKQKAAPIIKAICKKYGVKGTLSVRHHSTLVLTVKSGVLDFFKDYTQQNSHPARDYMDVNPYWYHEHFTGKCKAFLTEAIAALKGPEYFDKSDIQTDYFHCSHYVAIHIGRWDKPYMLEA